MEKHYPTIKILRRSIFTFLQNYQYFTTTAAFFAFPFAVSLLLAQSFVPSSYLQSEIHKRLLFCAAGFPNSSGLVPILTLKLSKTISVFLIISPLSFSFLLFAKASIILSLSNSNHASQPTFEQAISAYKLLLITQVCNLLLVLSANATYFTILFFAFNALDAVTVLIFSSGGAVLYSIILAYTMTVCNLALVLSAAGQRCGFMVIMRACVLIKGRTAAGLSLLLSVNMALASVESLFQYRIVRAYHQSETSISSMLLEGMFITYIYSIILVLDTVIAFFFFRSCKSLFQIDPEMRHPFGIAKLDGKVGNGFIILKPFDELP